MKIGPDTETTADVIDTMTEEQQKVMYALMELATHNSDENHIEQPEVLKDKQKVKEIIDGMTDKQRTVMYYMIGMSAPSTEEANHEA